MGYDEIKQVSCKEKISAYLTPAIQANVAYKCVDAVKEQLCGASTECIEDLIGFCKIQVRIQVIEMYEKCMESKDAKASPTITV